MDPHEGARPVTGHKVFLSNLHDEYRSTPMPDRLPAARNAGLNLALFDASIIYRQVRFEASRTGAANRAMVSYKETATTADPLRTTQPSLVTGLWHEAPVNRLENELLGTIFWSWKLDDSDYQRHGADARVQRMTNNLLTTMITGVRPHPSASASPTPGLLGLIIYDDALAPVSGGSYAYLRFAARASPTGTIAPARAGTRAEPHRDPGANRGAGSNRHAHPHAERRAEDDPRHGRETGAGV